MSAAPDASGPSDSPVPRKPSRRRAVLTIVIGVVAGAAAIWAQKALWPQTHHNSATPQQLEAELFPVGSVFDWEHPPLPPDTRVEYRLRRGSEKNGDLRLQLLCASSLAESAVAAFYEVELANKGWKKYNGAAIPVQQAGGLYRMGNLSLALQIFAPEQASAPGCTFRLAVLMRPAGNGAAKPTGAEPTSGR